MIAFLDNKLLVQQIGWTLLHTLWQGVAIAALLAAAQRVLRDAPAGARYVAACGAMTLFFAAAIFTFALLARPARETPPAVRLSEATGVSRTTTTDVSATSPAPAAAPRRHESDHLRYVVTTWLAGVTAMAAWHAGGWLIVIRLRRGRPIERLNDVLNRLAARVGVNRAVRLVEAAAAEVPAVIGVLRPVIVVPIALLNDLAPQHVEAILAHEVAHIRRHDYLLNLIQSAVETLMFYHPATWWISATIRRERENCCDDIAAKICGDERAYAAALAALEARRAPALVSHLAPAATGAGGAGAGGDLLDRVRRVLKLPPLRRRASRTRSLAAAALAVACVVLPLVVTAQEKPARPASPASSASPASPATAPADGSKYRHVKVLVGKDDLRHDGTFIDIHALQKLFAAMGEAERGNTVLEVAAASPDVTVERFFTATAALHRLAQEQKLAYLSQTGIAPAPAPAPAPATAPPSVKQLATRTVTVPAKPAAATTQSSASSDPELARLAEAVAQSQLQIQQLQKELEILRTRAATPSAAGLDALLQQRKYIELALEEMSVSLGAEHQQVKAAKAQIARLDQRIAEAREQEMQRRASMPVEEIAAVDATMRDYVKTLEQMEFNLQRLGRNVGPKNRAYVDAQRDVELQKERINTYADAFRRQFSGETITDPATGARIPMTRAMQAELKKQQERIEEPATQP